MAEGLEGIYTPARAGALAGVSGQTIGQWARYGLITPSLYEGRPVNLYSYYDVAEAVAVKWLLTEQFAYDEIHTAIAQARQAHPNWPLVKAPLGIARQASSGKRDRGVLVERVGDTYVEVGRPTRQVTLRPEFLFRVQDTLRTGGWIAKKLRLKRIEVDPGRLGGLPTLKGRRWAVHQVALIAADDEGAELLRADYGLRAAEIRECVRWAAEAAKL
jgi:uncharacterized protein (DUF433 family)/DNA-binding transcriptional MerR regulator